MSTYTDRMFSEEELAEIRAQFYYVDEDYYGRKRLFFDNAGGSLRLKKAEEENGFSLTMREDLSA